MSPTEILDIYKRGNTRLNVSARNCFDSVCTSTGAWVNIGENGSIQSLGLNSTSQYMQYRAAFDSKAVNHGSQKSAELWSLTAGYFQLDTCYCPGLNNGWEIDLSDYCVITTDCDLGTGNINFTGYGNVSCQANITTTDMGGLGTGSTMLVYPACTIYVS